MLRPRYLATAPSDEIRSSTARRAISTRTIDKSWSFAGDLTRDFETWYRFADEETVYDPNNADDQLVLGIKGTLSVAEMNVLRLRMQRGKEAKAKRGELFCTIAPGYVRDADRLVKDPNVRVQEVIALVFQKFLELGSIRQTYRWFLGDYESSGGRYCIGFGGKNVDRCIGDAVCAALSPQGIRASLLALEKIDADSGQQTPALKRQLQQAQYEADRAGAQFDQCDPNNRLVANTLEQRWNEKLAKVAELTRAIEAAEAEEHSLTAVDRQAILGLGERFGEVWNHPKCDNRLKKRLVRLLVKEIIVDIDEPKQQLQLIVHWHGGAHTQLALPRPMPAGKAHKTTAEDCDLIRKMAVRYSDAEIAQVLSKHGRKTGKGNRWTQSSVGIARRKLRLKPAPAKDPDLFNSVRAQKYLSISDSTLMRLIENKLLPATQLVPYARYEIRKADLDSGHIAGIVRTLKPLEAAGTCNRGLRILVP